MMQLNMLDSSIDTNKINPNIYALILHQNVTQKITILESYLDT